MLKYTLLFLFMFFFDFAFSQTSSDNEVKVGDYTAKVIQLEDGKYVFDVLEGQNLFLSKAMRPFFTVKAPFIKKENALLIAKWYLTELSKNNKKDYFLSLPLAREMGVTEEDLQFPKVN